MDALDEERQPVQVGSIIIAFVEATFRGSPHLPQPPLA